MDGLIKFMIRLNILQAKKSCITDSINHSFRRISIDSYNSLPIEKILTFYKIIILIKSVVNKNISKYYNNTILEKGLYKNKPNTQYSKMNGCML